MAASLRDIQKYNSLKRTLENLSKQALCEPDSTIVNQLLGKLANKALTSKELSQEILQILSENGKSLKEESLRGLLTNYVGGNFSKKNEQERAANQNPLLTSEVIIAKPVNNESTDIQTNDINSLNETIRKREKEIEELDAELRQQKIKVVRNKGRLDGRIREITDLDARVEGLKKRVEIQEARKTSLSNKMEQLRNLIESDDPKVAIYDWLKNILSTATLEQHDLLPTQIDNSCKIEGLKKDLEQALQKATELQGNHEVLAAASLIGIYGKDSVSMTGSNVSSSLESDDTVLNKAVKPQSVTEGLKTTSTNIADGKNNSLETDSKVKSSSAEKQEFKSLYRKSLLDFYQKLDSYVKNRESNFLRRLFVRSSHLESAKKLRDEVSQILKDKGLSDEKLPEKILNLHQTIVASINNKEVQPGGRLGKSDLYVLLTRDEFIGKCKELEEKQEEENRKRAELEKKLGNLDAQVNSKRMETSELSTVLTTVEQLDLQVAKVFSELQTSEASLTAQQQALDDENEIAAKLEALEDFAYRARNNDDELQNEAKASLQDYMLKIMGGQEVYFADVKGALFEEKIVTDTFSAPEVPPVVESDPSQLSLNVVLDLAEKVPTIFLKSENRSLLDLENATPNLETAVELWAEINKLEGERVGWLVGLHQEQLQVLIVKMLYKAVYKIEETEDRFGTRFGALQIFCEKLGKDHKEALFPPINDLITEAQQMLYAKITTGLDPAMAKQAINRIGNTFALNPQASDVPAYDALLQKELEEITDLQAVQNVENVAAPLFGKLRATDNKAALSKQRSEQVAAVVGRMLVYAVSSNDPSLLEQLKTFGNDCWLSEEKNTESNGVTKVEIKKALIEETKEAKQASKILEDCLIHLKTLVENDASREGLAAQAEKYLSSLGIFSQADLYQKGCFNMGLKAIKEERAKAFNNLLEIPVDGAGALEQIGGKRTKALDLKDILPLFDYLTNIEDDLLFTRLVQQNSGAIGRLSLVVLARATYTPDEEGLLGGRLRLIRGRYPTFNERFSPVEKFYERCKAVEAGDSKLIETVALPGKLVQQAVELVERNKKASDKIAYIERIQKLLPSQPAEKESKDENSVENAEKLNALTIQQPVATCRTNSIDRACCA